MEIICIEVEVETMGADEVLKTERGNIGVKPEGSLQRERLRS